MQRMISHPGGVPVGRLRIRLDGPADCQHVLVVPLPGRGPRDQLLDQLAEFEQLGKFLPGGDERPADHLVGVGPQIGRHERAAAAAAPGPHVTGRLQPLDGLPHGRPAHFQHGGEIPLGRQPLAGDELAERDRGHEALSDALAGTAHGNRCQ
jgi:hypothetical protein